MKKTLLCSLTILFFGCYFIPCNFERSLSEIKSKKEKSFFIGEYVLEKKFNNNFNNKEAKLILNKDGTIDLVKFSSKVFESFNKKEVLISTKNKWELVYLKDKKEQRLSLRLKFKIEDEIVGLITSGKLYIKKKKPVVVFEIGDPDECMAVRFIKK